MPRNNMKHIATLLLILLPAVTWGAPWWSGDSYLTDTVEITTLPYTCSGDSTYYCLTGDLWTNGSALTISCDWSVIDGQGNKITFDSNMTDDKDGKGGDHCIAFGANNVDHVRITDLVMRQAMADSNGATQGGTYGGDSARAVSFYEAYNTTYITIDNCEWYMYGRDAIGIYGEDNNNAALDMIEIFDNYAEHHVLWFRDRQYSSASIKITRSECVAEPDSFNVYAHGNHIDITHHCGILIGGDVAWQRGNYVKVDAFNEEYIINPTGQNTWDNCHGIGEKGGIGPGSYTIACSVYTGNEYYGGKGLYYGTKSYGTAEDPIYIDSNIIRSACGYTGVWNGGDEAGNKEARGLRVRYGAQYIYVRGNDIWLFADSADATKYIGHKAHGIWFTSDNEDANSLHIENRFTGNQIYSIWLSANNDELNAKNCCMMMSGDDSAQYTPYADGNIGSYNAMRTNCQNLIIGSEGGQGHSVEEYRSYRDSFFTYTPDSATIDSVTDGNIQIAPVLTTQRTGLNWCSPNNRKTVIAPGWGSGTDVDDAEIIDPYFGINGDDTLTWDSTWAHNGSGTKYIRFCRTLKITVTDSTDAVVDGAAVSIINEQREDTTNLETGGTGIVYDTTDSRAMAWSGCTKTADTLFTITMLASYSGVDTTLVDTLDMETDMGDDYEVTLVLPMGEGGGETTRTRLKGIKP